MRRGIEPNGRTAANCSTTARPSSTKSKRPFRVVVFVIITVYVGMRLLSQQISIELGYNRNSSILSSFSISSSEMDFFCNRTNEIVTAVRNRALLMDETEALTWNQSTPFHLLTCEQLIRSLPTFHPSPLTTRNITENSTAAATSLLELSNIKSIQRLAEKLSKPSLTVVVIGGSMSTGWRDFSSNSDVRNVAYAKKLERFLQYQWPTISMTVINLALGGANENTWLGRLDLVMELEPDVILVESAVNDQCDYDDQDERSKFVNETSLSLLNLLMNFPQQPSVISVELFRTAFNGLRDANEHCHGHVQEVKSDPSGRCFYCPQWWDPPTWRQGARTYNSVSQASYRDAVWPVKERPPAELCTKYWDGKSHPQAGVHILVASTIFFQFLVVMETKNALLRLVSSRRDRQEIDLKVIDVPNVCLGHISSYRALQGNPNDPFGSNNTYRDSCWSFRADVKSKYGWICEIENTPEIKDEYLHLSKKIRIGWDGKIIISRLVSYDDRMAMAQVWFTGGGTDISTNIFVGDPVWDISSWHEERTSIPQPYAIQLGSLLFKDPVMQWPAKHSPGRKHLSSFSTSGADADASAMEVTFNLKMLKGSSRSKSAQKVDNSSYLVS